LGSLSRDLPTLGNQEEELLVFLACISRLAELPGDIVKWAASNEGRGLRRQLIESIRISQPSEKLGLTLAALLGHTLLLCDGPRDWTCGAYLLDFNAILAGQFAHNERTVLDRTMLSILRTSPPSEHVKHMHRFLDTVVDIEDPGLAEFDGFSDQY
jgi:hypothetical protein